MEGDMKRLEELMKRLPTDIVFEFGRKVKAQHISRVVETISKRLKKDMSDLSLMDDPYADGVEFVLLGEYEIEVFVGFSAIAFKARHSYSSYFYLEVEESNWFSIPSLKSFPDHVKERFLALTGLRQDVLYTCDTFEETLKTSVIGQVTQDYLQRVAAVKSVPLYYIRQQSYTVLAIHKFRRDSVIARLPKDVLKIILEFLWHMF